MSKDEVTEALMAGVTTEGALMLMNDHLADAHHQLDKLKHGGMPNFEASDAVFTLFARLASALDSSVVYQFPVELPKDFVERKVQKQFTNFPILSQLVEPANNPLLKPLEEAYKAVDDFRIAADSE